MLCDFCNRPNPTREFRAISFVSQTVEGAKRDFNRPDARGQASEGGWSACDTCANLIDSDQWEALAKRSCEHFLKDNPDVRGLLPRSQLLEYFRQLHQEFKKARL